MPKRPDLKQKRNAAIRQHYNTLASKKVAEKQLYRHDAILEMLSSKYFLSAATIDDIVSYRKK